MLGIMFIIYVFLPETPTWCVRTGKLERARQITRKIYRGVRGFDEERYLQQIALTLEHEKAVAIETKSLKWYAPLIGTNRVSFFLSIGKPFAKHSRYGFCVSSFPCSLLDGWASRYFSLRWHTSSSKSDFLFRVSVSGCAITDLVRQTGFADPFLVTCIVNGLLMAGALAVSVTIDKLGRRKPYLAGVSTLWLVCVVVGALSLIEQTPQVNNALIAMTCIWGMLRLTKQPA